MSKIRKPHQYRPGNIPLRYCVPTFDEHRVPYRLRHAVSKTPKDDEECFICMEKINFRQRGSIATPCCDHFVHKKCIRKWNETQREQNKLPRCAMCRRTWDTTALCAVCQQEQTSWRNCKLKRYHPQ